MLTLALLACQPGTLSVETDSGTTDTIHADADADADADTDTDTDTDTDSDTDADQEIDFSTWSGFREFAYDDCKGHLSEEGTTVDPETREYGQLQGYCGGCEHFYELDVGPETECGFTVTQHTFRALLMNADDTVEVFYMDEDGRDGGYLASATWTEPRVLSYEYNIDTIVLEGVIEFDWLD
jgi:hypothetical protein